MMKPTMYRMLCEKFIERADALGLKGKKRDDYALEFMIGAATTLALIGHPEADHVCRCSALLVSTRGYLAIVRGAGRGSDAEAA